MLQSTDFGVLTLEDANAPALADNFYVDESLGQKLCVELDFDARNKTTGSKNNENATSIPQHILVAPVHYESGYSYPLLVWLHDSCNDERQLLRIMPQISLQNYVAVAPRGKAVAVAISADASYNYVDNWDDFSITALLKHTNHHKTSYDWFLDNDGISAAERSVFDSIFVAKKSCNVAANRIFIGGVGSGGTMALRLALLYPEYFAGVAAFDSPIPNNTNIFCHWSTARNLAVFLGLKQADKISSATFSGMLELFYSAGFKLTVRDYQADTGKNVKDLPKQILQEVNRWMMAIVCDENDQKSEIADQ
ncbi:MAG: hypothetical protein LBT09_07920 [Planctomycetaceae bacterium]|jgi:phospholipase/carboxylesterase|nr:hypothetical protein [Planctomycetaceae bacterium]